MSKFLCQSSNYIPRVGYFSAGKTYDFEEKPNHHFLALDEKGEINDEAADFDPSAEPNFDADTYDALMAKKWTKKAIVSFTKENYEKDISKVDQGMEGNERKGALVHALIEARENYVAKPSN